jgi:hypothetical protein
MNITSLLLVVAHAADLPADFMAALFKRLTESAGVFFDDAPDSWQGLLSSALAGVAAALAVAIALTFYFRSGYRSVRDIFRHGLAAAVVLGLAAFVAYDMRHAALAYLGINPAKPAVEFEIRLPKATINAFADSQVELLTDRNQRLATVLGMPASDADGESLLRGSVPLDFRTTDRVVILDLPGQVHCEFKLRLAASPTRSEQFGPWHLADRVASPTGGEQTRAEQNDAFAIRYRVL